VRLRVLVYNVHGFREGLGGIARVVEHIRPDVALLNETGSRRSLRAFAKEVHMQAASDPWSPFARRVKDAVLVRSPWRILEHRLHRFSGTDRMYPRGVLLAHVGRAGERAWVASVHLGLRPVDRLANAKELAALVRAALGEPLLIGGDCNELPDGRAIGFLSERFGDAWLLGGDVAGETFPARDPTARIDYLFVSEGVRVERASVPGGELVRIASDHRPVVAELTLPERRAPERT
jgi:endonuclease/exonuclease/phosphatase family metal-dependent hydrolase